MSFLDDILQVRLSSNEYIKDSQDKKQIYLHHTAGSSSGERTINYWNQDNRGRIATCVCISNTGAAEGDGKIVQAFSSKYWAYHLGIKREVFDSYNLDYVPLDKRSIGIELCAWGHLEEKKGGFYNYVNKEVPKEEVCTLEEPFKGHRYYHRYSDEQIRSTENLLKYWKEHYNINTEYNARDMWGVSKKALRGESGIFTHNSVRKDKSDIFPQPEIIEMLKLL